MNQRCIVAHPKLVWSRARILQRNGQATVLVRTDEGEEMEVKAAQCCEVGENTLANVNPVADLCLLDELHAGLIYDHLRERYYRDEIYTYIGPIVVSVNPFCRLANIPTIESIASYLEKDKEELAPHLYHIGKLAYQSMRTFGRSQAVIISGESGAGKTEATKIVLRFLTTVSSLTQASERGREIAQLILATNPILEAFGNAKTVRNNNSSRFGKFIKIIFDRNSNICGGEVVNYLLEKTRIVYQAPTERNYHIFYQLLAGTTDEEKAELHLRPGPADYAYLMNGISE